MCETFVKRESEAKAREGVDGVRLLANVGHDQATAQGGCDAKVVTSSTLLTMLVVSGLDAIQREMLAV